MSRNNRREEPTTLTSLGKAGAILSQAFDKIYFTHKDTTAIVRITLKTKSGCSFQTIATWDLHADGGYGRCSYVNKNAREELQKLRNGQNYKIAYLINNRDEHELVFEPDL